LGEERDNKNESSAEKLVLTPRDKIWLALAICGIIGAFVFIVVYGLGFIGI
jgi:hypothetical protein